MSQTIEIRKDILIKVKDHAFCNRGDSASMRAVFLFIESWITVSHRDHNKINSPENEEKQLIRNSLWKNTIYITITL